MIDCDGGDDDDGGGTVVVLVWNDCKGLKGVAKRSEMVVEEGVLVNSGIRLRDADAVAAVVAVVAMEATVVVVVVVASPTPAADDG